MTLCPIAIAVGCKKCPAFAVCPSERRHRRLQARRRQGDGQVRQGKIRRQVVEVIDPLSEAPEERQRAARQRKEAGSPPEQRR